MSIEHPGVWILTVLGIPVAVILSVCVVFVGVAFLAGTVVRGAYLLSYLFPARWGRPIREWLYSSTH